jgi:anaerobic dimethyl sulfoxide reductase subunit A
MTCSVKSDQETLSLVSHIPVSCNRDCGGGCALLACVEDGRVTRLVDNPAGGPYMQGCVRGYQMPRVVYAPDRLRAPLLRTGPRGSGQFRTAGWDETLDYVAERLTGMRDRYGAESILHLGGSGSCRGALHHTGKLTSRFLNLFGGCTETHGNYSSQAVSFVLPYLLGTTQTGVDPATLQYSRLILLWGANVADCRFGSETFVRIQEAKQRGVEVVSIEPRRSATVKQLATRWVPVWPGGDGALMLALMYVLFTEDLAARDFTSRCSIGADELERYVLGETDGQPKTPAWAETRCGTPAAHIYELGRLYGQTRPAALLPGLSIQRTLGGEDASRLAVALQVLTGNLGLRGGSTGANCLGHLPGPRMGTLPMPHLPHQPSLPVYRWPDGVLEGQQGGYPTDIRAIYNVGGNYLVQGSDVGKNVRALESVELAVTHDCFLTPTARYSDVVLPTTTFLERQDIVFVPGNYVCFSNQALPPVGSARNDYDIFCDLAGRLGFGRRFSEGKDEESWLRGFVADSDVPDYEEFRRTGIHAAADRCRTAFADFVGDPSAHRLRTPSGRIEIRSETYAADTGFPALPGYRHLPVGADFPLRLITPKSRYRVHSQGANIPWLVEREPQALWINPADAGPRGIGDGQLITLVSPAGTVRVAARVTEDIVSGVVCLLEGMWPSLDAEGRIAAVDTNGSANMLTSTEPTRPSQGSRTHSVLVQVKPA